uniref:Uncharacterized protein n=1 Tax=Vitrella brassicaformis TaxID=1169539 RepID=A0A7S1JUB9_9ALVE
MNGSEIDTCLNGLLAVCLPACLVCLSIRSACLVLWPNVDWLSMGSLVSLSFLICLALPCSVSSYGAMPSCLSVGVLVMGWHHTAPYHTTKQHDAIPSPCHPLSRVGCVCVCV